MMTNEKGGYAEAINRNAQPVYTPEQLAHCRIVCVECDGRYVTLSEAMACVASHKTEANK